MSRLENSGNNFREELVSRNLYTPTDIYDISNPKLIQAVNSISRLLRPGNAFDFSNTIIGRVIGPQTPLTQIARRALTNLFTEQIKSTIIRKNVPKIEIGNIFNGKPIFSKNIDFSITKENPSNIQEKLFNILKDNTGVNSLINPIKYNTERISSNYDKNWIYNTTELSELLVRESTGKGQLNHLEQLLSNNIFSNNFGGLINVDNTNFISSVIPSKSIISTIGNNFNLTSNLAFINLSLYYQNKLNNKFYATENNTINKQDIKDNFGKTYFISDRIKDVNNSNDIVTLNDVNNIFTWGIDDSLVPSKGILGYTNAIFNILNDNKSNAPFNKTVTSIQVNDERYYNGIRFGEIKDDGKIEERSYSIDKQMDTISKTIKPFGYSTKSLEDNVHEKRKNSPLYNRPIPKILFTKNNTDGTAVNDVMFSIENLAHSMNQTGYDYEGLYENGPNNGRILWFSPTILDFNETDSPNITTTNFLGRSEPVYTYANTERKLTINFYMIVDHVDDITDINSFEEYQEKLYNLKRQQKTTNITNDRNEITKVEADRRKLIEEKIKQEKIEIQFNTEEFVEIPFYFPNNIDNVFNSLNYQSGTSGDPTDVGLNKEFGNKLNVVLNKIKNYITSNPNAQFRIETKGYASALSNSDYNQKLSLRRANSLIEYIKDFINTTSDAKLDSNSIDFTSIVGFGETLAVGTGPEFEDASSINTLTAIKDRKATISGILVINNTEIVDKNEDRNADSETLLKDLETEIDNKSNPEQQKNPNNVESIRLGKEINDIYSTEPNNQQIGTFQKIKDKKFQNGLITYTPYELYKRLTFLHQCTRQGATPQSEGIGNSVFGKPPIIVFRLGDMYNTKAIITSLTIDFDNELPWDLNPEGFGVQKMGCKVALSLNLIGGSSVDGPKKHILNADSRRFYANSRFEANSADILDKEERIINKEKEL